MAAALLALQAGLLAYAGLRMSPTMDEPAHLAAGVSHWKYGRFTLYSVNPPLVRMVAALPVLAVGYEEDWSSYQERPSRRSEFPVGRDFAEANGERFFWLMTLARWACIPFSLIGGWVSWRWANDLFGSPCGLVALTLWCFSPNVIAHGSLMTPDIAGASLGVLATWLFWRWLQEPKWGKAGWAGLSLGLVWLTKATWIVLWGVWPVLWLIHRFANRDRFADKHRDHINRRTDVAQLIVIFGIGLYLLNLGYGFEGSLTPLGDYEFVSEALGGDKDDRPQFFGNRFAGTSLAAVPVPLPSNFVLGVDAQKLDFEGRRWKYLRGELSRDGWWYFYLYALLVKVPLGTGLIAVMALITAWQTNVSRANAVVLMTTPVVLFIFISAQSGLSYLRYLLPVMPFVFIGMSHVGRSFANGTESDTTASPNTPGAWSRRLVIAGIAAMLAGSLWVYPHSLSYFNIAAGGPSHGHRHLIDSNLDWGQDLFALRDWVDEHPEVDALNLAYFGPINPRQVGVDFTLPPETRPQTPVDPPTFQPSPGWYAVSASYVYGGFGQIYEPFGESRMIVPGAYGYFRRLEPVDVIGTTIFVYHVDE